MNSNEDLVDFLVASGSLHSERVISAFRSVDRSFFVDRSIAYIDSALPFLSVTTSQPSVIALSVEKLRVKENDHILEIGTGSGYQTAILSKLALKGRVTSLEINKRVFDNVKSKVRLLGLNNVEVFFTDGRNGFKQNAPYNAIICSAGVNEIPKQWLKQLAERGRLIAPVGVNGQWIVLVEKRGSTFSTKRLIPVVFIPLE